MGTPSFTRTVLHFTALLAALVCAAPVQAQAARSALIIGISAYADRDVPVLAGVPHDIDWVNGNPNCGSSHCRGYVYSEAIWDLFKRDLPTFYGDQDPSKRQSSRDVRDLLRQVQEAKADGLLLDLSRNGGGKLESSVQIAGLFIPDGGVVATALHTGYASAYLGLALLTGILAAATALFSTLTLTCSAV